MVLSENEIFKRERVQGSKDSKFPRGRGSRFQEFLLDSWRNPGSFFRLAEARRSVRLLDIHVFSVSKQRGVFG